MTKTINFKALAAELAALEKQGKGHGEDLLIARVLHNMSPKRWEEFCKAYPASNWGALPVSSLPLTQMADAENDAYLLGDELRYAISAEKFVEQVDRELLRMNRVGGELSVLATTLLTDVVENPIHQELEKAMADLLQANLENCDSMAPDTQGNPLLLLPGTGPVRSRHLAEQMQRDYTHCVAKMDPKAKLVIGLVSIAQGEKIQAPTLVDRAKKALTKALNSKNYLHQIGPEALDERSTLVHSDEKRFLFFGGASDI